MGKTPPRKWDRFDLTYSIWDYEPCLDRKEQIEAVRQAFDLWEADSFLKFKQIADGQRADIELRWVDKPGGDHAWAKPPPGSSGQQPDDGNVWFNLDREWTLKLRDDGDQPIDFLTLCIHEVGHAIGLGHHQSGLAVMRTPYQGSIRRLSRYDITCLTLLYEGNFASCTYFDDSTAQIRCD